MQILIGFHAIEELLLKLGSNQLGIALHVSDKPGPRVKRLIELSRSLHISVQTDSHADLDTLASQADHRGAVLVFPENSLPLELEADFETELAKLAKLISTGTNTSPKKPLILALDSITDPHNLGAIIRSADKFGVDLVLIPQRRSAQETETVRKSSAGASAWVQTVVVPNLHRALLACRDEGFLICGADMAGIPAPDLDAGQPLVLVMGSEGKGIGRLLSECCDAMVNIPCTGHVDSFNVSVATGILLYEIRRQQAFSW